MAAKVPTYAYEFADQDAPNILGVNPGFDMGAAHAFEIQYVFNSEADLSALGMSQDQIDLANAMVGYWTRFAKTGNPNSSAGTGTNWPNFATSGQYIQFDAPGTTQIAGTSFAGDHDCSFWSNL